jgi:hypothetical protein
MLFQLSATQLAILMAVSATAGWLLRRNLWRAGVWVFPTSVRVEDDAPADAKVPEPLALESHAATLQREGGLVPAIQQHGKAVFEQLAS